MNQQALRLIIILLSFVTALSVTLPNKTQDPRKIIVPLKVNDQYEQFAGFEIKFDNNKAEGIRLGKAPGGVLVAAEKLPDPKFTYRIKVDSDADGSLDNGLSQDIQLDSSTMVWINRKWANGRQQRLPYIIKYSRYVDKTNETRESFLWISHYRAEGKLRINNCETLLVVLDLNGDGLFDQRDFSSGTSIGLDRNGDGRIWGKDEWLKGRQIIDYCGATLVVDSLEADGSTITLVETILRPPKIGEPLPAFSMTTDEGKAIDSDSLRGKVFLLDFWASWCLPCVEKFARVKQLEKEFGNELETIAINVDEQSYLQTARNVIKKYGLKWPQIMSGQGEADPIWKTFGGMVDNQLAIPFYVLVDHKGMLRYAGNGGDNLSELSANIRELIQKKRSETIKR